MTRHLFAAAALAAGAVFFTAGDARAQQPFPGTQAYGYQWG